MISKERLEELINKCATVYMARAYTEGIYLMPDNFEVNDKELVFKYKIYVVPLEDLFETKEEAEWHKEFGCIERTERLELPTWEEFLKLEKIHSFKSKNNQIVVLFRDGNTIYLEDEYWNILREDLTKENYTLACRKAKELFLGEKK